MSGKSITEAAAASGYRREHLSKLVNHNPIFRARLNERREDVRASICGDVQQLISDITAAVRTKLEDKETPPGVVLQAGLSVLPKLLTFVHETNRDRRDAEATIVDDASSNDVMAKFFHSGADVTKAFDDAQKELEAIS
jgi:hypothetical protein